MKQGALILHLDWINNIFLHVTWNCFVRQHPKSGLGHLIVEVSRSHIITHTHARARTHGRTHAHTHARKNTHAHTRTHTRTRTHARTHTRARPVGILWNKDQLDAVAGTYSKHNKHNRRTFTPSAGMRNCDPSNQAANTDALDKMNGMGWN